jgi:hypothetical protein
MPVPPELQADIDALGVLRTHGELVFFQYHACGHKNWFPCDSSTWSTVPIMRAILAYHRSCFECAHPYPEVEPTNLPDIDDPLTWIRDVHADRHPVPRAAGAAGPVALSQHRVVIEGVFPDLVRFRLPAWSEDAVLYVERKRLPPEVDEHLLHAGYQFFVDADLDALTPEALIESFR